MSPNMLDYTGVFCAPQIKSISEPGLAFSASDLRVSDNGIEFQSPAPISLWTEMKMELHSPLDGRRITCTGVVVECRGSRQSGFRILAAFVHHTPMDRVSLSSFVACQRPEFC